jgi:hypothetical protein
MERDLIDTAGRSDAEVTWAANGRLKGIGAREFVSA